MPVYEYYNLVDKKDETYNETLKDSSFTITNVAYSANEMIEFMVPEKNDNRVDCGRLYSFTFLGFSNCTFHVPPVSAFGCFRARTYSVSFMVSIIVFLHFPFYIKKQKTLQIALQGFCIICVLKLA